VRGGRGPTLLLVHGFPQDWYEWRGRRPPWAAFEVYRAIPANATANDHWRDPIAVPLLLVGGEHVFGPVLADVAINLQTAYGWADVTTLSWRTGSTTSSRNDPTTSRG
jgi:hypothetical protein